MALPRQRCCESDVEFSHRLEEYHRKERARDKARKRYKAAYNKRRYAAKRAVRSEDREAIKRKREYLRKKERRKARMAADPAYAEWYRRSKRISAKRCVEQQKQSGDNRYYRKLLRQRGYEAVKRIRTFGRGHGPFAGEAGERRFIKALRSAFIYGVILFENFEAEKDKPKVDYDADALLKRGAYSMSRYERMIFSILTGEGVAFEREKEFPWLRSSYTGGAYRVDFYLPDRATAIEYNGAQHYFPGAFGRDNSDFVRRQCYDLDKYEQLEQHGVRVIVIDYRYDTKLKIAERLLESGVLYG